MEYLEERFPEPNLIGGTPEARAFTREVILLVNEVHSFLGPYINNASQVMTPFLPQRSEFAEGFRAEYLAALNNLETIIGDQGFLCGDSAYT